VKETGHGFRECVKHHAREKKKKKKGGGDRKLAPREDHPRALGGV